MIGLNVFILEDRSWGKVKIARIVPRKGDSWGRYAFLKGTVWGDQIPLIEGGVYSDAMYGRSLPLIRGLGTPPHKKMKRIPKEISWCRGTLNNDCVMAGANCYPCEEVPDCYEAQNFSMSEVVLLTSLVLLWKEGAYVIRVEGGEFTVH